VKWIGFNEFQVPISLFKFILHPVAEDKLFDTSYFNSLQLIGNRWNQ